MTTTALEAAEGALEAARLTYARALTAANDTKAAASALRARVLAGTGQDVGPSDLAAADQAAEHAALVLQGAESALPGLSAAVQAARADEECDAIVEALPGLGSAVLDTLDGVTAALEALCTAAAAYDDHVAAAVHRLDKIGQSSPRVDLRRYGPPTVDRLPLSSSRGAAQLARVVLPTLQALRAPTGLVEGLKTLAAGAPNLPEVKK